MSKKLRVAVLFGGKSAEHEVSLQSAKSVIDALDKSKYEVLLVGIGNDGRWYLNDASKFLLEAENPKLVKLNESSIGVVLLPGTNENQLVSLTNDQSPQTIDVVFPVLHGTFGEDGTVQGLLKLANVPFVGPSVLGSAVGMDKDVMKRLLRDAGLPIADFVTFTHIDKQSICADEVIARLGLPLFVKPANLGSSVGVHKVRSKDDFDAAVADAFRYDNKIIIEENIFGREIEIAVLGNADPTASVAGEVIPQHDFYSYEAKYIDQKGAVLHVPAKLPADVLAQAQELAVETFKVLCCEGMSRVDLFLRPDGSLIVNEINTIPGFTKISMYPKLWEESGLPYSELLDKLIQFAIERFEREQALKTSFAEPQPVDPAQIIEKMGGVVPADAAKAKST
jgi:D-alanine-D-alanine ligase